MQMLQFPYRAVFGDRTLTGGPALPPGSAFTPRVGFKLLAERFEVAAVKYDPDLVAGLQTSARWSAAVRTGLDAQVADIVATWDRDLLREPRVLVPVDVQALVVPRRRRRRDAGAARPAHPRRAGRGGGARRAEAVLAAETERAPGVHLHWAMPDALLRGTLQDPRGARGRRARPGAAARPLGGPAAARPGGRGQRRAGARARLAARRRHERRARPRRRRPARRCRARARGRTVPPAELTGTAGGTLTWTGRLRRGVRALRLARPARRPRRRQGARRRAARRAGGRQGELPRRRLVVAARTSTRSTACAPRAGWPSAARRSAGGSSTAAGASTSRRRASRRGPPGSASRWASAPPARASAASCARPGGVVAGDKVATEASTLAHGAVIGVPVDGQRRRGRPAPRRAAGPGRARRAHGRPRRRRAGGRHGPRPRGEARGRAAALRVQRAAARPARGAGRARRDRRARARPRVRHARERRAADRRPLPGPGRPGAAAARATARLDRRSAARSSFTKREDVRAADRGAAGGDHSPRRGQVRRHHRREREDGDVRDQPAEPAAQRGSGVSPPRAPSRPTSAASRSPRRRITSRSTRCWRSPGRRAACATATTAAARPTGGCAAGAARRSPRTTPGWCAAPTSLPSLGSGALPGETLALAREVVLLSPHLARLAGTAGERRRRDAWAGEAASARIGAELSLRYDATGAYTMLGGPKGVGGAGTPTSGGFSPLGDRGATSAAVHEALRRHSLLDGVEPDLVGITAWAQPWVPMWVEYELTATVADEPRGLAARRGRPRAGRPRPRPPASARRQRPRAADHRARRRARRRDRALADRGDTRATATPRARPIRRLRRRSPTSARGRGARPRRRGARRRARGAARAARHGAASSARRTARCAIPRRCACPTSLAAGSVRLDRARLVDAFGRTLDLDLDRAAVPARLEVPGRPAALLRSPRFTAPARVRLRLVDAAAPASRGGRRRARRRGRAGAADLAGRPASCCPTTSTSRSSASAPTGRRSASCWSQAVGGGVVWEAAPGRPLPADAPPGAGARARGARRSAGSPPAWSPPTPPRAAGWPRAAGGVGAVGLPARDRHDAVELRPARRRGHRGAERDRRPARRGRPRRAGARPSTTTSTSWSSTPPGARRGRPPTASSPASRCRSGSAR